MTRQTVVVIGATGSQVRFIENYFRVGHRESDYHLYLRG